MRRRGFLQHLATILSIPLVPKPPPQPPAERAVEYGDSEGRTHAQLASLGDGTTRTGGIVYQG